MFKFTGVSQHPLDEKRRVTIPKRFFEIMEKQISAGTKFVITLGLDGCLLLTDRESFESTVAEMSEDIFVDKTERARRRLLVGHVEEGTPDKTGRLLLPEGLRKSAGVDGTVVMIGVGSAIEIWSDKRWEAAFEATLASAELFFGGRAVSPTVGAAS